MHKFTSMGLSAARLLVLRLLSLVLPEADDRPGQQAVPLPRRQQTTTGFTSDPLTADQVHTVTFGLDGTSYQIELSAEHAAALRDDLAPWVSHARRTSRSTATKRTRRPTTGTTTGSGHPTMIRRWARANGHNVSDRGRLPAAVRQAYNAAH